MAAPSPSSIADRLIWLRRPARLVESDIALDIKVDKKAIASGWERMVADNPRMTDGPCLHVLGVRRDGHGGATIHVTRTTYRMAAVRSLGITTGFVGLGIKAIAHWRGKCLIGQRSASCATYPSHWEFAPGGSVEPGEDPIVGIGRELMEELGIFKLANVGRISVPPTNIAVFTCDDRGCSASHYGRTNSAVENPSSALAACR